EQAGQFDRAPGSLEQTIDIDDGQISAAGCGDVKAEPMTIPGGEELGECLVNEIGDFPFPGELGFRAVFAEEFVYVFFFEVEALDFVFEAAAIDLSEFDDAFGAAHGVAHVFLFEHFGETGALLAILKELLARETSAADLVDLLNETGLD